ncbi:MAG: Ig-like domain-containing protein, partial [Actinomycetota bacterium]|nr:Ig-like domain-containing protein [Actinomycetota bacterium]
AWSPRGDKIAFGQGYPEDIFVVDSNGSNLTNLSENSYPVRDGTESQPAWSPDGSEIVMRKDNGIWVMNADGSNQRDLNYYEGGKKPAWSPDGAKIAYLSWPHIKVMNTDGSEVTPILDSSGMTDVDGHQLSIWSLDWQPLSNADTTPPSVSLTAPQDGATVSGTSVSLSADATDDKGVSRVDFYVGSQKVGSDTTAGGTSTKEYSVSWDSTTVPDGGKIVQAKAYDAANNEKVSSKSVTVKNDTGGDTTAPTIASSVPTPERTGVSRTADVKATFSEEMDRNSVVIGGNVQLYKSGTNSPISMAVSCVDPCKTVTMNPSAKLAGRTWYMAVIWKDPTGVKDKTGNLLSGGGAYQESAGGSYVYWWFKTKRY